MAAPGLVAQLEPPFSAEQGVRLAGDVDTSACGNGEDLLHRWQSGGPAPRSIHVDAHLVDAGARRADDEPPRMSAKVRAVVDHLLRHIGRTPFGSAARSGTA